MPITGDDHIDLSLGCCLQDTIIGGVVVDHAYPLGGLNDEPDLSDLGHPILGESGIPSELLREDPPELRQQGWRGDELYSSFQSHAEHGLGPSAGKVEGRDQDVGIEHGPQVRRSSWISRSTSGPDPTPSRLRRPKRCRDSKRSVSRHERYTRNISRNSSLLFRPSSSF